MGEGRGEGFLTLRESRTQTFLSLLLQKDWWLKAFGFRNSFTSQTLDFGFKKNLAGLIGEVIPNLSSFA